MLKLTEAWTRTGELYFDLFKISFKQGLKSIENDWRWVKIFADRANVHGFVHFISSQGMVLFSKSSEYTVRWWRRRWCWWWRWWRLKWMLKKNRNYEIIFLSRSLILTSTFQIIQTLFYLLTSKWMLHFTNITNSIFTYFDII